MLLYYLREKKEKRLGKIEKKKKILVPSILWQVVSGYYSIIILIYTSMDLIL